ncbi:hypothetical protein ABW19_dt0209146 [Dactylella cylindrospora]|nr:hypothetical protein ABW19_dt0209146 [Dactylella cylindrospora]
MLVADLGNEEVLLAANDTGYVALWYTKHLVQRQGHMDIWFDVKLSAWGLSVHKTKRLIAISANTTHIAVYEMGSESIDPERPPRGASHPIILHARQNNIPCVSFLQEDPSGRWLVATDIRGNVILYDLLKGNDTSTNYGGEGWTVTLTSESNFLWVESSEFRYLIEKAKSDIEKRPLRSVLDILMSSDSEDDSEDEGYDVYTVQESEDWTSDAQMTLYGGEESEDEHENDEDEEDDGKAAAEDPPVVEITEAAQTAAYGPIPVPEPESSSDAQDGPSPPPPEEEDPPWDSPPRSYIIHSKEYDLKLLSTKNPRSHRESSQHKFYDRDEHITSLVTLRDLIPADSITVAAQNSRFPLRMNMHAYIPALSLFVVGRQDGRVALVRLIRAVSSDGPPSVSDETPNRHLLHLEHVIPVTTEINIPFALAGVCVAPIQGWHDRNVDKGIGEGKGQGRWLHLNSEVGGRWRVFMLYTDGTVICYTITGGVSAGGDQSIL